MGGNCARGGTLPACKLRSREPTICRERWRGNVQTPNLYFLNGLIKSNQFTSLHAFSSPSRSKTKTGWGKKTEENRDRPTALPRLKPMQIPLPSEPYRRMHNMLGKPIQMPAGRDKWLIRAPTMKGSHQLSEGLSQKYKDTLPKKKRAKRKQGAPATPFFPLIYIFLFV